VIKQTERKSVVRLVELCLVLALLLTASSYAQVGSPKPEQDETALEKLTLLSDLKNLAVEVPKIEGEVSRAFAYAEIADAAWELDREWAQGLLRDAYKLTYPAEDERSPSDSDTLGSDPRQPSELDVARTDVRTRIISIARRDETFADELTKAGARHVSRQGQQSIYSNLAREALDQGDNRSAIPLIERTMETDPTQLAFTTLVNDLAKRDREAADKLILQCIANLKAVQLSNQNRSAGRAYFGLMWLIFPNSIFPDPAARVPEPGPVAMKAYVAYIIDSLGNLEQREPGAIKPYRFVLVSVWLPLKSYAPELTPQFLQLEALSRTPGRDSSLPTQSYEEADRERFQKQDNEALNDKEPSDRSINSVINREEFDKARKLINKLPDGERKSQFLELVNMKEALRLANKGELLTAQSLAERLTTVNSIVQVYPAIISRYAANKDQVGASASLQRAIKQLGTADTRPFSTLPGMPPSAMPTGQGSSSVLSGLVKLAMAILPVDSLLASDMLEEMVAVANKSDMDTKNGRTGFDKAIFRKVAAMDEARTFAAAQSLKNPLRRTVALAAIYQWKAKELEKLSRAKLTQRTPPKPEKD
jgi:hypothetical protein